MRRQYMSILADEVWTAGTITSSKITTSSNIGNSRQNTPNRKHLFAFAFFEPLSTNFFAVVPFTLRPLPLGTIEPKGWLEDNLQLMADGLAGHMHDFYRFVRESPWLGGSEEYSSLGEGFPYWLNGMVPLAYALDDKRIKAQISSAVDYVISKQDDDGWLGPEKKNSGLRNLWARFPLLLGLTQLLEADSATYAPKVLPAIRKFVVLAHDMLSNNGTGLVKQPGDRLSDEDHGWGQVRMADMLLTLQWLYENDDGVDEDTLLEAMEMLRRDSIDWATWYTPQNYIFGDLSDVPDKILKPNFPFQHGVNVGQGKASNTTLFGSPNLF
jgi:hypothetical protein